MRKILTGIFLFSAILLNAQKLQFMPGVGGPTGPTGPTGGLAEVDNALTTTLDTTRWGGDLNRNTRIITDTFAVDFISDTTLPSYSTLYHLGSTTYPYEVPFLITLFRGQHYGVLKMDENQYYQLIANDSIGWESVVQNQIAPDGSSIFNGSYTKDNGTGLFYQNICYQQFATGASNVEMSLYKDANAAHVARDIAGLHLRYGSEGAALHTILTDTTADAPYGLYGWQNKDYVTFAPQSSGDGTAYPAKFSVTVDGAIQRFDSGAYSYTIIPHQTPFDSCLIIYDALGNPYLKDISSFGGGSGWGLTGNEGTDPNTNYIGTSDGAKITVRSGENNPLSNVSAFMDIQRGDDVNYGGFSISQFDSVHASSNYVFGNTDATGIWKSNGYANNRDTSSMFSCYKDSMEFRWNAAIAEGVQDYYSWRLLRQTPTNNQLLSPATDNGTVTWRNIADMVFSLPSYGNDVDAGGGGLVAGQLYQTTGGDIAFPFAGVLMVKQ